MKVLNEGRVPEAFDEPDPWWVGQEMFCGRCNFKGVLERSDRGRLAITTERTPNGDSRATMRCPTQGCHAIKIISRRSGALGSVMSGFTPRTQVGQIRPARFDHQSALDRAMRGDMGGVEAAARKIVGVPEPSREQLEAELRQADQYRGAVASTGADADYAYSYDPRYAPLRDGTARTEAQLRAERDEGDSPDDLTLGERNRRGV